MPLTRYPPGRAASPGRVPPLGWGVPSPSVSLRPPFAWINGVLTPQARPTPQGFPPMPLSPAYRPATPTPPTTGKLRRGTPRPSLLARG